MFEASLNVVDSSWETARNSCGQSTVGRQASSMNVVELFDINVLALLADPEPNADFRPFYLMRCSAIDEFDLKLASGAFDCVIFDAALAGGWTTDAAIALAARAGRNFALIILLEQSSDLMIVNNRINARDVWCLTKSALQPGDLTAMLAGLATLKNVQARDRLRN